MQRNANTARSSFVFIQNHCNPFTNKKILDQSKLKDFANDKIKCGSKIEFIFGSVEHIVGKGENAGYQHFHLFPQVFHKAYFSGSFKVGIVW